MTKIRFVVGDPPPTCGAPSSKSKNAMHCELPPNHRELFHNGRDRMGRWRCWDLKP